MEVPVEGRKLEFFVHLSTNRAVTRTRRHSCDRKSRHVTVRDPEVTGSHLEVAVEGRKRVLGTFELLQVGNSQVPFKCQEMMSRDRVTGSDPEVTLFDRKSCGSCCGRPKTRVLGAFEHKHSCNSQEEAFTRQEMTAHHCK